MNTAWHDEAFFEERNTIRDEVSDRTCNIRRGQSQSIGPDEAPYPDVKMAASQWITASAVKLNIR